jgi:iron uptake system component EfeO
VGVVISSGDAPTARSSTSEIPTVNVSFDRSTCAAEWKHPQGGTQEFVVHNTTIAGGDAYLEDADTGAVFADFEAIGTNAKLAITVTIGYVNYRFVCLPAESDPVRGAKVSIAGSHVTDVLTPAIMPVTNNDMYEIVKSYEQWVIGQLPTLQTDVMALDTNVRVGDLAAARSQWLVAHLDYERLGAAYGAFGDADGAINGTTDGLPDGVNDAGFIGFHRIEYLLWHGASGSHIVSYTSQLATDVAKLQADFANAEIGTLDLGLRAHEIMENAVQFEATGRTDYGSGSNLATIDANIDGTRTVLALLKPVLDTRIATMNIVQNWLDRTQTLLQSQRSDVGWLPLSALSPSVRRTVNADLSELTEQLAPIAAICDIRQPG